MYHTTERAEVDFSGYHGLFGRESYSAWGFVLVAKRFKNWLVLNRVSAY